MMKDIARVLISEEELHRRIREMGRELAAEYEGKEPVFIGVLKGVVVFFSDMIRAVPIKSQIDLLAISSYGAGAGRCRRRNHMR